MRMAPWRYQPPRPSAVAQPADRRGDHEAAWLKAGHYLMGFVPTALHDADDAASNVSGGMSSVAVVEDEAGDHEMFMPSDGGR